MKLKRLKITDPKGYRSLQPNFEHHFRTEWELQEETGFAPFILAGPNGSGKSNLLEALAAIFFQLEVLRVRRSFLPESFLYDEEENPKGFQDGEGIPNGFEINYLIKVPREYYLPESPPFAEVTITKPVGKSINIRWVNHKAFKYDSQEVTNRERQFLLPQYILGYSSGENEILSLPFFKMRFIQFDEYENALKKQLDHPGKPEIRLAYLDNGFSQAILLSNLLIQDKDSLKPYLQEAGIQALKAFRIIIRRTIQISDETAESFGKENPALITDEETGRHTVNLMKLLEADERSADNFNPIITRLKRCATCFFFHEATDTLYLDYFVNVATKEAFRANFDQSPLVLFQSFQMLLTLNLYSVSETLKAEIYHSNSHYVSESVPTLASDERVMQFDSVKFSKSGIDGPVMLKSLSDGEHQLLHTMGLALLFRNTNSLFLLDEPETHFNPDWRSRLIFRLYQCFSAAGSTRDVHEMLITTHTPFLISDSAPEKVLVFEKSDGRVSITRPDYNTLGASINKITMKTFGKRETIGGHAQWIMDNLRKRFENGEDKEKLITEIDQKLGDSVEKMLLIKTILESMEAKD